LRDTEGLRRASEEKNTRHRRVFYVVDKACSVAGGDGTPPLHILIIQALVGSGFHARPFFLGFVITLNTRHRRVFPLKPYSIYSVYCLRLRKPFKYKLID
jgi:hypothetical protein